MLWWCASLLAFLVLVAPAAGYGDWRGRGRCLWSGGLGGAFECGGDERLHLGAEVLRPRALREPDDSEVALCFEPADFPVGHGQELHDLAAGHQALGHVDVSHDTTSSSRCGVRAVRSFWSPFGVTRTWGGSMTSSPVWGSVWDWGREDSRPVSMAVWVGRHLPSARAR